MFNSAICYLINMKSVLTLVGLLLLFQGGYADIKQELSDALNKCVTETNQNKQDVLTIMGQTALPEDNSGFSEFFECFSKTLGVVNNDKDVDYDKLIIVVEALLKPRLGNVLDVDVKAKHIATAAVNQCRNAPKAETVALTAIRRRNCVKAATQKPELH